MITLPGYRFLHLVYEDDHIWICYAYSEALSRVVLWKMVKDGPRSMIENAKLIHEYETLSLLRMGGVLKPHTLLRQGGSMVLLFDIINGIVLRQYMAAGPVEPAAFLKIAIGACEIIEELHRQELLHMNLRPDTILLVPETMQVCLTGFSDSVPIRQSQHATRLEGNPPYMAPERTNGFRRQLDGRTDLYSLGITFFEMLAGELPFQAREPLEWAHAHVAKPPPSLSDKYGVPDPLSSIVAKLLEKVPEDRYQTAGGLKADLLRCMGQVELGTAWTLFKLGESDKPAVVGSEPTQVHLQPMELPLPTQVMESVAAISSPPIRQSGLMPFSDSGYTQMLDLAAVFKATQIFASTVQPQARVRLLLQLALEQAGATRGCWVIARKGGYSIEFTAGLEADHQWGFVAFPTPLELSRIGSPEIIRAVAGDRNPICLGDVTAAAEYRDTKYVQHERPRSILCFALATNEDIPVLLYMENKLSSHAFSLDRLGVLSMVAMQLYYAVSLSAANIPHSGALHARIEKEGGILTSREIEVLEEMAAGLSNKEIAARLTVAAETVKVHARNIYAKLGGSNRVQAIEKARRLGLIR